MKAQNTIVKLQSHDEMSKIEATTRGPFEISHGQVQIKPVFEPFSAQWTPSENAKYVAFVLWYKKRLEGEPHSKLWGLYEEMSAFVGSRNFRQCKNHHNRFRKASMTINKTIQHFTGQIDDFERLLAMQKQNLKIFDAQRRALANNLQLASQFMYYENQPSKLPSPKFAFPYQAEASLPAAFNFYQPQYQEARTMAKPLFFMQSAPPKSMQQEWMECHNLFLQWTGKVKELNELGLRF